MSDGTAPRKVNGVWVTRKGRKLSDAGQRTWDRLHAEGRADGKGHYERKPSGIGAATVTGPKRKPAEFKPLTPELKKHQARDVAQAKAHPEEEAKRQQALDARYFGKKAKQAGFSPGALDKVAAPFTRPLTQVGSAMAYSPAGVYQTGRAGVKDVGSAAHGDLSFKRTRKIGKEIVKATVEDVRHPIRNAGYLALDLGAAVSAGAGTAARLGAVGKAVSEGGRVSAVARALAHAPEPKTRTLRLGDLEAHPIESRNKAFAAAQRGHDRYVNKQAAKNPEGRIGRKYLPSKVGKTLAEERRLVTEPGARAPAGALQAVGKKLSTPEQYALRIVAEQKKGTAGRVLTVADRKAFHVAQGDKRQAKLTEIAGRYLEDTPDGPKIKAEHKDLQAAYDRVVRVAGGRDALLKDLGKLDEARAAGRAAGPAQVIGGAKFEKPTPGKLGKPSASLIGKRQRVERLQSVYDRALSRAQEGQQHAPSDILERGPMALNRADLVPKGSRNDYRALINEADRISTHLQMAPQPGEAGGLSKTARAKLIAQRDGILQQAQAMEIGPNGARAISPTSNPTVARLGSALSVAKDELASHEKAAAGRVKPTGLVGAEDLKGSGEVRIPYAKENAAKSLLRPTGLGRGRAIGGAKNPPSLTHSFTGGLLKRGGGRQDVTRLVAESNVEAQKLSGAITVRNQIADAAVPHPPEKGATDYVAIRLDNPTSGNLSPRTRSLIDDAMRKGEEGIKLSRRERQALRGQVEDSRKLFIFGGQGDIAKFSPAEQEQFAKLYDEGKVGWVNRRLLGGLDQPQQLVGPGVYQITNVVDAINNATRFAVLYLKPAYAAPNILGNLALNLIEQGFASPVNLARSARVNAKLSADAAAKLDAHMGEGFVRAISGDGGIGRSIIDTAASVWSKGVDTPFRRSAFIYEARRALRGIGERATWENIDKLLTDPAYDQTLSAVVRRANKEIIDYGRLGPIEREVVRRIVFFYPWVKGSTMYAGRFVLEHPIKAAAVAKLGQQGEDFALDTLGPVPSTYKGSFKAGGGLVNPASAAILGTPAQVVEAGTGLIEGNVSPAAKLAQFITPAASIAQAEISRVDPRTGYAYKPGDSALSIAYDQLVPGTPQASLVRNLKGKTSGVLRPTRNQAIGKFMAGGLVPQDYDAETLAGAARKEQRSLQTPLQRTLGDHMEMRAEFLDAAKAAGMLPQDATHLPKPLRDAITTRAKRYANYAKNGVKSGQSDYQQRAFELDVDTLIRWKKITPSQARTALKWAAAASHDEIENERRKLGDHYFGGDILSDARAALKERGVPVG